MSQLSNSITIIFDIFGNNALQKTKWQSQVKKIQTIIFGMIKVRIKKAKINTIRNYFFKITGKLLL